MSIVSAILVGVSEYTLFGLHKLPFCKNDLRELKASLIYGLGVREENIITLGENGMVLAKDLFDKLAEFIDVVSPDDTVIFYFSGHGGKGYFTLTDQRIRCDEILNLLMETAAKCKIIIMDCCRSGEYAWDSIQQWWLGDVKNDWKKQNYAIMTSCGAGQDSGFDFGRELSIYTSFLCDAINATFLISDGKKSLNAINEVLICYAIRSYYEGKNIIQDPVFLTSMNDAILFDVDAKAQTN